MKLPLPKKEAHRKRLKEWERWLKNFKAQLPADKKKQIIFIPNAAWLLNELYWRLAEQYLRPILTTKKEEEEEHKIHPYKIISTSEITVMMVEPISIKNNPKAEKQLNASLAWFIAIQIIEGWDNGSSIKISTADIIKVAGYKENIEKGKHYPESFSAEHIQWLTILNVTSEKPLLINAQCWRLFYISCLAVAGKGKLNPNA